MRAPSARIYPVLPSEELRDLAERTLLAHLDKLIAEERVKQQDAAEAVFALR